MYIPPHVRLFIVPRLVDIEYLFTIAYISVHVIYSCP